MAKALRSKKPVGIGTGAKARPAKAGRASATSTSQAETGEQKTEVFDNSYRARSQRPLACLFFLLPMLIVYEVGALLFATDYSHRITSHIYARTLLHDVYLFTKLSDFFLLPSLIVVLALFCWHLIAWCLNKARWEFEPALYGVMLAESVVLATPLLVFAVILQHVFPHMALQTSGGAGAGQGPGEMAVTWQAGLIFSFGAGVYEELLFRLIGIAILHTIFVSLLRLSERTGTILCVLITSVAFAIYHFSESNPFTPNKYVFYVAGGVYFGVLYIVRGFGITAGTHAMYDVMVVLLR